MNETVKNFEIEEIDNYLMEMEEAEEALRLVANLCKEQESIEFIDPKILKYIGDFLMGHLDKTISARHYFLKLDLGEKVREFGIAGEVKKLEIKHSFFN